MNNTLTVLVHKKLPQSLFFPGRKDSSTPQPKKNRKRGEKSQIEQNKNNKKTSTENKK